MSRNVNLNGEKSLSQTNKIRLYLEQGGIITDEDARRLYKCHRLASRISDLRTGTHCPKREVITLDVTNYETGTWFAAYYIPDGIKEKYKAEDHKKVAYDTIMYRINGDAYYERKKSEKGI